MDWSYIFLGFLQGVTEFLPISSSGHLFLMEQILNSDKLSLSFVLLLHAATFFSILAVFHKEIKSFVFGFQEKNNRQLLFKLLVSLSPLLFVGLFFKSFVQQSFEKDVVVFGFLGSGLLLLTLFFIRTKKLSLEEMSFFHALLIGLAQAVAVLPGFSRSGWTIAVALYCGLTPRAAVYYSFLISLPAIAGSALVDLVSNFSNISSSPNLDLFLIPELIFYLCPTFLIAFFTGWLSLILVLKTVQNQKLYFFSLYLLPLSFFVFFFL